jgi:aromatic ring-opening dioxygenase catalytic subunit (LigB family)
MPLLGRQPALVKGMQDVVTKFLPKEPPSAIVVISAHWEADPISINSSPNPSMYYDYGGFPKETFEYQYPAQGSPALAQRIQNLLTNQGLESHMNDTRGYDHGVFVPLMIMYPEATIPVVQVSLHKSLDPKINIDIGKALAPLRDDNILILGSGYTFHNFDALMHPSTKSLQVARSFNTWLKETILLPDENSCSVEDRKDWPSNEMLKAAYEERIRSLEDWASAPGGRFCHPREEHLLPLLVVAAAGGETSVPTLIHDSTDGHNVDEGYDHAVTGYMFK